MVQWINVHWNNSLNLTYVITLLCKNSELIHLAKSGLMVSWLAGRQNTGKFQILKFIIEKI